MWNYNRHLQNSVVDYITLHEEESMVGRMRTVEGEGREVAEDELLLFFSLLLVLCTLQLFCATQALSIDWERSCYLPPETRSRKSLGRWWFRLFSFTNFSLFFCNGVQYFWYSSPHDADDLRRGYFGDEPWYAGICHFLPIIKMKTEVEEDN